MQNEKMTKHAGFSKRRSKCSTAAYRSIGSRSGLLPRVSDLGNDPVLDRAYLVDLAPDGIADDQRFRRLESEANTPRSSSENDIPRLEGHGLRKFGDLLPNVEDQVLGI